MPGDMVVALGQSTVDHAALFGHNSDRPAGESPRLQLVPGRSFSTGEIIQTQFLKLTQVRQTLTVLGCQQPGQWGYEHGVNKQGVAIGRTSQSNKLRCSGPVLTGADLVRLALERSRTA